MFYICSHTIIQTEVCYILTQSRLCRVSKSSQPSSFHSQAIFSKFLNHACIKHGKPIHPSKWVLDIFILHFFLLHLPPCSFSELSIQYSEWWHSLCSLCQSLSVDTAMMRGKIVLCFGYATNLSGVKEAGGVGVIVAKDPVESMPSCDDDMPCVQVDYEIGTQILYYIRSSRLSNENI